MNCNVRKAVISDVDALAPLFDAYRQFYGRAPDVAAARAFLAARILADESVIFIAERAGIAVGFTQLYPLFSSVRLQRLWLLNDLYVAEGARRGGAASALLAAAHAHARDSGASGVLLETQISNREAQALYEKTGYRRNETTWFYEFALD